MPVVAPLAAHRRRSPDLVEDQVTYPLVRALQSTPQSTPQAKTVRGSSMFGMSFVYVIFDDDTDIYGAWC